MYGAQRIESSTGRKPKRGHSNKQLDAQTSAVQTADVIKWIKFNEGSDT